MQQKTKLFAVLERREVDPALAETLFAASPGRLIGPVDQTTSHTLIQVLSFIPGELNERTRSIIKDILFQDWLAERRKAARIEWCWGNVTDTSNRT